MCHCHRCNSNRARGIAGGVGWCPGDNGCQGRCQRGSDRGRGGGQGAGGSTQRLTDTSILLVQSSHGETGRCHHAVQTVLERCSVAASHVGWRTPCPFGGFRGRERGGLLRRLLGRLLRRLSGRLLSRLLRRLTGRLLRRLHGGLSSRLLEGG